MEPVAEGRVDSELHAVAEAVVDDRRDQRALLRHRGLALDHRADLEHVVRGQVLRARVAEPDLRPVAAERLDLSLRRAASRSSSSGSHRSPERGSPRDSAAASCRSTVRPLAVMRRDRRARSGAPAPGARCRRSARHLARGGPSVGPGESLRERRSETASAVAAAAAAAEPLCDGAQRTATLLRRPLRRPRSSPIATSRRRRISGLEPPLKPLRRAIPGSSRADRPPRGHRRRRPGTR